MRFRGLVFVAAALFVAGGCAETSTESGQAAGAERATWLLESAPADVMSVTEAKSNVSAGQRVAVLGRIGGRVQPISSESPVFVIVDLALPHCGENPADECPTPWDYCCEPGNVIAANSATVQLVGDDGAALDVDPVAGGLGPLDEVVVVGDVAGGPGLGVLSIRATGVYVQR